MAGFTHAGVALPSEPPCTLTVPDPGGSQCSPPWAPLASEAGPHPEQCAQRFLRKAQRAFGSQNGFSEMKTDYLWPGACEFGSFGEFMLVPSVLWRGLGFRE